MSAAIKRHAAQEAAVRHLGVVDALVEHRHGDVIGVVDDVPEQRMKQRIFRGCE